MSAATTGHEPQSASPAIDEELLAVITAAIHETVSGAHRIVSIKEVGTNWSIEGRRDIFSSHRFR